LFISLIATAVSLPSSYHEVPFFRLLVPLVVGILVQLSLQPLHASMNILLLPVIGFCILVVLSLLRKWELRWVYGLMLNLFMLVCGLVLSVNFTFNDDLSDLHEQGVVVRLTESPQLRARSLRAVGKVVRVMDKGSISPNEEKVLLYFSLTDSAAAQLQCGDIMAALLRFSTIEEPQNPYQFNFKQYMLARQIRFSSFVEPDSWARVGHHENGLVQLAGDLRRKLLAMFSEFGLKDREYAVVSALTVGYTDLLDDALQKTYSTTGAMHILSVSGLHVGLVYGLLAFLLSFLPKRAFFRIIKLPIQVVFLWFFALITGLSPPVCRSAFMFSLVAVGQGFNFRTNILNTLAAAAFALLVANPNNLLQVGFQLSFLAVLSIVVFHPFIYRLFTFKSKILDYFWSLIAVSVAAQLGTIPVTLAAFGQFPTYFMLSNIIAIPLSTLILYAAVALVVFSPVPLVGAFIGKILLVLTRSLNGGLQWIESLPHSSISGVYISRLQMLVLLSALVFISLYIVLKHSSQLRAALLLMLFFFMLNIPQLRPVIRNELVVFHLPGSSMLCIRNNGLPIFIGTDSVGRNLVEESDFFLGGYISRQPSGRYGYINLCSPDWELLRQNGISLQRKYGLAVLEYNGRTVALPYSDSLRYATFGQTLNADVLVVNRFARGNLSDFIKPEVTVVDASVRFKHASAMLTRFTGRGSAIHNLSVDGAYTASL